MKVVWTEQAKNSLAQIYDYIIRNRPEYADFVIDAILKKADTLNDKRINYPKDPISIKKNSGSPFNNGTTKLFMKERREKLSY